MEKTTENKLISKNSIAGDSIKLSVSKAVTTVLSMVVAMILSRFRTLEEYGTYSQMLLVINLFSSIFMLGLPSSINFFLARADSDGEKQQFLSIYFTLSTAFSIVCGALILLLLKPIEAYFDNGVISKYWFFMMVIPWSSMTISALENISIIYKKTNQLVFFNVLHAVVIVAIVLVCSVVKTSFYVYVSAYVIGECIFAVSVYFMVNLYSGSLRFKFKPVVIKQIFKFCIPLGLASAVGMLTLEADKLMVGYLFDTKQLAIYTNAAKELPVSFIAAAITAVLMPRLVILLKDGKNNHAVALWGKTVLVSFSIICLIAFGCIIYAKDVISILYSPKYADGVNIFRIYCLILPLRCTYWGIILNSVGKTKFIFISALVTLGVNLILNYLFYLCFGILGPPLATLLAILSVTIIQILFTAKILKIKFTRILPWGKLLIILVLNVVFAVAFYYIKEALPLDTFMKSEGESVLLGVIWAGIYALIMYKTLKKQLADVKTFPTDNDLTESTEDISS